MQMNTKRLLYALVVTALGLALAACERQRISDIKADPGRFENKEITVAGTVTQSIGGAIGRFGGGVYQIDDGSGTLWVWSESHGVPSRGAHVGVKGRITPTVTFLGINYATVMRETDRRAVKGD
jgi:hypothetical protein